MKKINIKKEDIIPYVYFVCSLAHGEKSGSFSSIGGKSDYIGGILDRFINIIPESIIFNNHFLPQAIEQSGRTVDVTVYSDFFRYNPKTVGIAPDLFGIRIGNKTIPFVKYDENKTEKPFWVEQPGCPQVEVKSFFGRKYMVSLRDQHYGDKFLIMVSVNLDVDYLLPFFNESIFNEDEMKKLEMPSEFIIPKSESSISSTELNDSKRLISSTGLIDFDKSKLGTVTILATTTASLFKEIALELEAGDIPRYFVGIEEMKALVKEEKFNPNLPFSYYCDKQHSGLYRFNDNWKTLFTEPNERTLDIYIEKPENLLVVKTTKNSIRVLALEDSYINDETDEHLKLERGKQYNINFDTFGKIAGKEYFMNKGLLEYLPNKEQELITQLAEIIQNN